MRQTLWNREHRRSTYTAAYRRERRRRVTGWLLVVAGSAMACAHIIAHLSQLKVVGPQDVLLGYPMAAAMILAGFITLGVTAKA
ncbi:hypothetical protein [Mycobacterium neglectum]|uniref:hypothetical protein n=1 Tax=Mycobacterium neglectum TaxID=242737 RepID=UPI000BFEAB40|nr:hypothetical protein [Mycobacterium neglectum]